MMVFTEYISKPLVVVWIGQLCSDVNGHQNLKVAVMGGICCFAVLLLFCICLLFVELIFVELLFN